MGRLRATLANACIVVGWLVALPAWPFVALSSALWALAERVDR